MEAEDSMVVFALGLRMTKPAHEQEYDTFNKSFGPLCLHVNCSVCGHVWLIHTNWVCIRCNGLDVHLDWGNQTFATFNTTDRPTFQLRSAFIRTNTAKSSHKDKVQYHLSFKQIPYCWRGIFQQTAELNASPVLVVLLPAFFSPAVVWAVSVWCCNCDKTCPVRLSAVWSVNSCGTAAEADSGNSKEKSTEREKTAVQLWLTGEQVRHAASVTLIRAQPELLHTVRPVIWGMLSTLLPDWWMYLSFCSCERHLCTRKVSAHKQLFAQQLFFALIVVSCFAQRHSCCSFSPARGKLLHETTMKRWARCMFSLLFLKRNGIKNMQDKIFCTKKIKTWSYLIYNKN